MGSTAGARGRYVSWSVHAPDPELGEIVSAEAFAAGAGGIEEAAGGGLRIFAEEACAARVAEALAALAPRGVRASAAEPVPETDWSTAWRHGLEAVVVDGALVVRPPFVHSPEPELPEVVIEPAQAFGTGGHASTRLALRLLLGGDWPGRSILDVGTGSGVLALAALRLGALRAVGLDLDPLAAPAAAANARANGLEGHLHLYTGPLEALAPGARFDVVVANMIRSEQEPILAAMLHAVAAGGRAVLSGLLREEEARMTARLEGEGFAVTGRLGECDERGDDWLALEVRRP